MTLAVVDTTGIVDSYIELVLEADSIIQTEAPSGVWEEVAEQGTPGRFIKYVYQRTRTAGNDTFSGMQIVNDDLIYEIHTYLICMVGENDSLKDLKAGATRIKQLFHKSKSGPSFTEGKILWSRFVGQHKEQVPVGDQTYPERGGFYEFAAQPPQV